MTSTVCSFHVSVHFMLKHWFVHNTYIPGTTKVQLSFYWSMNIELAKFGSITHVPNCCSFNKQSLELKRNIDNFTSDRTH